MKFLFNKIFFIVATVHFMLFDRADAQSGGVVGGNPPSSGGSGGLSYNLKNPLAFNSLQEFILAILNVIIVIATPIVVLFIIFAGFKYVTARGEPGKIKEATQALTYAVIGGVLILGAVAIAEIIKDLVSGFSR
jgi:hypothetical protein